ncbi:MAG: ABC transporter permease [Bacillota bacterium]|nr:ABC transporter permease [Bacillota bacterium]
MKVLHIAVKDLLITIRDWQGLLIFLVMPLVLTAILGSALGGNFAGMPSLSAFEVAIVDNDGGELAVALRSVLDSSELKSLVKQVNMTEAEARDSITTGRIQVALVIPQGFTESMYAGRNTNLLVLKDAGASLRPMIVDGIANSFVEYVSAGRVATSLAVSRAMTGGVNIDPLQVAGQIIERIQALTPRFREEVAQPHRSLISSFQYYAAAMAVMFMMSAGSVGLQSIASEKRNLTWERLLSSPTSPGFVVIGKFFAVLLVNSLQFMVLMLGTTFVYKVAWGDSMLMVMAAGVCYAVAVSGLSLLVAALVPSSKVSLGVWNIGVQACAALGGSMVPVMIFPNALQSIARLSPNFWGIRMFTALMGGEALRLTHVLPLLSIGVVALCIGGGQLILKQRRA